MKIIFHTATVLLLFITGSLQAQQTLIAPGIKEDNFIYFSNNVVNITDELNQFSSEKIKSHPEYGILPYNAPCDECFELIEQRTFNTRHFVKNGTDGKKFYSNSSWSDLHFKNEKGEWITIDPRLRPSPENGLYHALQQPNATTLNMIDGYTSIKMFDENIFKFNEKISIHNTNNIDAEHKSILINRNNYTVGDDGAEILNAFDGVKQQLIFGRAKIKSNYILSNLNSVNTATKYYVIEDEFDIPEGYRWIMDEYEGVMNSAGFWHGDLILENEDGMEMARIKKPVAFDADTTDQHPFYSREDVIAYQIEQNGSKCILKTIVLTDWLKAPERIFPITIDPTVFGTTATWTGTSGADDSPTFCNVTLSVPTPANATLTGSNIHWEYRALGNMGTCGSGGCKLKHLQVRICTTCDCSPTPAGIWGSAANIAGLWIPTIDDATTKDLVECFTPQCTPFNIDFTIYFNQFSCVTVGGCVLDCSYLEEFQVTIEGETVTATALAGGGTSYTVADCALQSGWLNPSTTAYGVPGYTYSWSPIGATDDSVYVIFPMGVTVYTVTITDACGNTATDAVTVTNNCLLLPINLISLTGYHNNGVNNLIWTAEANVHGAYIIEKSQSGNNFVQVGQVAQGQSNGTQSYSFTDDTPSAGTSYYRLKQLDINNSALYSDVIAIKSAQLGSNSIEVSGINASTNELSLALIAQVDGTGILSIYDISGKTVFANTVNATAGTTIVNLVLPELAKGAYIVSVVLPTGVVETKFVY